MKEFKSLNGYTVKDETARNIAKGRNQAVAFGNYSTMITALKALSKDEYKVGQNIYIGTVGVPDLWVYSVESTLNNYEYTTDEAFVNLLDANTTVQVGYYKLSMLEGQRVDLTEYEKTKDADEKISAIQKTVDKLNSEIDSVKTPTFSTASTRENIESDESNSTLFGKIAKWFSDLKTGAFNAVANNVTTSTSGYVLDARQGKALSDKITSGFTRMTSSAPGQIVLPNGAKIVFAYVNCSNFTSDSAVGAYSYTADLSSYGLKNPVFGMVTGLYANGLPEASIKTISKSSITIVSPVNVANCSIYWMVIG